MKAWVNQAFFLYNECMRMRKRKWVDSFLEDEKTYLIENGLDFDDIYLEIGMGMGDFIVESALRNPDKFYIGLEKDPTCVARAIKKAIEKDVKNLKISHTNAEKLLECFKPSSVKCIYLHFSDPWPKKRNHKRRLTYPTFLKLYETLLKDNGTVIFKTDNHDLFIDSLEYFKLSNFKIEEVNEDYHSIKRDEPLTAYEAKFKEAGNKIHYVRLIKA